MYQVRWQCFDRYFDSWEVSLEEVCEPLSGVTKKCRPKKGLPLSAPVAFLKRWTSPRHQLKTGKEHAALTGFQGINSKTLAPHWWMSAGFVCGKRPIIFWVCWQRQWCSTYLVFTPTHMSVWRWVHGSPNRPISSKLGLKMILAVCACRHPGAMSSQLPTSTT